MIIVPNWLNRYAFSLLRGNVPHILQSLTVSNELIRVAMLWHELWHEHLEEASRLYFTEKNADAMITHLDSLHHLMEQVGRV